jgi:hypothetical protein
MNIYTTVSRVKWVHNRTRSVRLKNQHMSNIYTTVFRVKWVHNRTRSVRLLNRLTRKTVVSVICNMKPCNITSRSLGINITHMLVFQSHASRSIVYPFSSGNRGINITHMLVFPLILLNRTSFKLLWSEPLFFVIYIFSFFLVALYPILEFIRLSYQLFFLNGKRKIYSEKIKH